MSEHADKARKTKSQASASETARRGREESVPGLVDNRPEMAAQRKISGAVNDSQQVRQVKSLESMVNAPVQRKIGHGLKKGDWVVGQFAKREEGKIDDVSYALALPQVSTAGVARTVKHYKVVMNNPEIGLQTVKPDEADWVSLKEEKAEKRKAEEEAEEAEAEDESEDMGVSLVRGPTVKRAKKLFKALQGPAGDLADALSNLQGALPKSDYKKSGLDTCVGGLDTLASKANTLANLFPAAKVVTKPASMVISKVNSALKFARLVQAARDPENMPLLNIAQRMDLVYLALDEIVKVLETQEASENFGNVAAIVDKLKAGGKQLTDLAAELLSRVSGEEEGGEGQGAYDMTPIAPEPPEARIGQENWVKF